MKIFMEFKNEYLNFNIELIQLETNILGQWVKVDEFMVDDTFTFWQTGKVYDSIEGALEYIRILSNCKSETEVKFYRWCEEHRVKEGTIIQFEDETKGIILGSDYAVDCLKYSPIKKDGSPSKLKRNLYGNLKYEVVKY